MSESARKDVAYPKSQVETPRFIIFKFCGGMGGGGCPSLLGDTEFVYPIRVPKHLVFNKSLLLNNPFPLGVDVWSDAGASGFCATSLGTRQPWWLAFSDNGILTETQIKQRGIELTAEPPFEIEVDALKLPQPVLKGGGVNPNWENRIYVHIWWGDPNFVTNSPYFANRLEGVLEVVKHNYDIKL